MLAVLVFVPVNLAQELNAIQIRKAADTPVVLRGLAVVTRLDVACRVQDGFTMVRAMLAHSGPLALQWKSTKRSVSYRS